MVLTDQQFRSHVEEMSDGRLKCKFCEQMFAARTSISRIKWHFSGVKGRGVGNCPKVPRDVQEAAFLSTDGANKRLKTMPSSSNNEVGYATSTSPPEQNNEHANLMRDAERILMEERNLSSLGAGFQIENRTREATKLIPRTCIAPERPPVVEHETRGAAVQTTDLLGLASAKNWAEILALSQMDPAVINEANTTISTSLQIQKDEEAEADPLAALPLLFRKLMSEWESRLLQIRAMLDDAEQEQLTDQAMKVWLDKLRDMACDVEDILDEFQTEASTGKLKNAESRVSTSTVHELPPTFLADVQPKLQKIAAGWEDICKEKNDLGFDTNVRGSSNAANQRVFTTSLVKEPKVYGRGKAKDDLVDLLMKNESNNSRHSVIPIVGMGGIGKTTLAQLAYNDERVEFGYKAWVCVSDDFDISRLTKSMLRGSWETHDLNVLQEQLKEKLHGKKFFIVLDDVWDHTYEDWTTLCAPFAAGAPGSKIIITTRGADVANKICSVDPYFLKELPYDECLCLFAQHAVDAENFDANPDLKEVGQKIVRRCKGLPLAAKTLGGLLRHKQNLGDWEDILNSDMWELSEGERVLLSALRLSYLHLPSHLKRCFAYCAIFPKDYEFDEDELVLLWMAEGFLEKTGQKKRRKDLGHKYFKELLSRSLFQECGDRKSRYVMHDFISDLAQSVSGEICFHLDDKKSSGATSYAKVRHLSFTSHWYDTSQKFKAVYEMESLRTFLAIPFDSPFGLHFLSKKVLDDLVPKLKCLRALSLAHYRFKELPRSIGALKHLRYLNLSHTLIERLPESLGELLNLQTLILCGCRQLEELPAWMGNLIHLQHLDINDTPLLQKMPFEICKLKNLRFMPTFVIGDGTGLGIGELMRLPNLQGKLHITGLDRVTNFQDAKLANLKDRKGLRELALEWSYRSHDAQQDKQVLSSLEPHLSLEKLSIISYDGTEFPSWFGNSSFSKIVELKLHNCRKVTSLPSLVKLFALRHLSIKRMDVLKEVVMQEFPSLETLIIEDMLIWEKWSWSNCLKEYAAEKFPKLRELRLKNCPMFIEKLPSCLPSLKKLHIYKCPHLTELPKMLLSSLCELDVEFCPGVITDLPRMRLSRCDLIIQNCDEVIFRMVPNFTFIRRLEIREASGLVGLGESFVQALVALEDLDIVGCKELKYLWQDGSDLNKFANLKRLKIHYCSQLVSLAEGEDGLLPCNLQVLSLSLCKNLEKLPNGLHLTSLRELAIFGCPKLVSFPEGAGVPYTLKSLQMISCDSMESLPDRMMTDTVMSSNNSNQCLLEELEICGCPSLKSFPRRKLPTTLKELRVGRCGELGSGYWFLEGIMHCDARDQMFHSYSHLQSLSLQDLSLTSFPTGELPTCLKTLSIFSCDRIQSLPSLLNLPHLTELAIQFCNELESFSDQELPLPNLIYLCVIFCKKLRSLPDHMDSLQQLEIDNCSGLVSFPETGLPPKLTSLTVTDCENLRNPISEWRLHTLTSLKRLHINFISPYTTDVDYFPDDDGLLLPTSLTSLRISDQKKLKSISSGIQHLTSLETLEILYCPKLHVLPKEGFPATLKRLLIKSSPLLKESCLKEEGVYRPLVGHIPFVEIYGL